MSSIIFRGAIIRYADLRFETEGGIFARLHLQADLSGPVCEEMGWGEIPDGVTSAKLTGKLTGRNMILTPADKALRLQEIQMECSDVGDFAIVPTKSDDGEVDGYRLNFIARSQEPAAIAKVEQYRRVVGASPAALKVTYEQQTALDFSDASNDGEKEEAEPIDSPQDDAPLPSVTQMAGTTAELRRQRRKRTAADPIPTDPSAPEWRTAEEIASGTPHHVSLEVV